VTKVTFAAIDSMPHRTQCLDGPYWRLMTKGSLARRRLMSFLSNAIPASQRSALMISLEESVLIGIVFKTQGTKTVFHRCGTHGA
jgi:hypothetical protein